VFGSRERDSEAPINSPSDCMPVHQEWNRSPTHVRKEYRQG